MRISSRKLAQEARSTLTRHSASGYGVRRFVMPGSPHSRTPGRRLAAASVVLLASVPTFAACSAPRSRAATGPIAQQVEAAITSGTESFDHAEWDRLLAGGIDDRGFVDYAFFQDHRADLDRYLAAIAEVELSTLAPDHLLALLLNAYNALTIASILDHPTVPSIREIDGVWNSRRHPVGGFQLTLDEIEHTVVRPLFRDPRIHFAVNCASASCAPLPRWAFDGDQLDRQLEERTRQFLSDPSNVRIEGSTVLLSSYFDWYGGDFVAAGWEPRADTVLEFVAAYAAADVAARLRSAEPLQTRYLEYDWSLNAAVPPRS
ncbi:MAG TPA: DUF547 domain-containing protein [Thermoanaerobaculia bacterium]|nr:DUF547 domain-containing protein [Thermoanaerobaculia bacterium]